jgi:hypothetical protein
LAANQSKPPTINRKYDRFKPSQRGKPVPLERQHQAAITDPPFNEDPIEDTFEDLPCPAIGFGKTVNKPPPAGRLLIEQTTIERGRAQPNLAGEIFPR